MAFNNLSLGTLELTGQVVLPTGNTSVVVNLPITLPSNNYKVFLTPENNTVGFAVLNKTTTSFTINIPTSLVSDTVINWLIKF